MKITSQPQIRVALIIALFLVIPLSVTGQTAMPEALSDSTLKDQLNYIQVHTLIYENYRAIREDMFQKIKNNVLDSLCAEKSEINRLKVFTLKLGTTIDSLNTFLEETKNKLDEITRTKNSIRILGLEVNKITYNTIMWLIVAGLITILAFGFLGLKRNMIITIRSKKEFEELKNEFEAYRKASREAREKMSMAHFNEIKKLKGG
jgi:hypothetical protein